MGYKLEMAGGMINGQLCDNLRCPLINLRQMIRNTAVYESEEAALSVGRLICSELNLTDITRMGKKITVRCHFGSQKPSCGHAAFQTRVK